MNSPFPGMDPYLEVRWSDVHVKMIGFMGEALQSLLPRALRARGEERILLESDEESPDDEAAQHAYRSDIAVVETGHRDDDDDAHDAALAASSTIATVEPILIRRQPSPIYDRWVQIIDVTSGNRVVTAIEVLSPGNK